LRRQRHPVDLEKLVLWCEFELGLSERTARQYIELVCKIHGWPIREGRIHPPDLE